MNRTHLARSPINRRSFLSRSVSFTAATGVGALLSEREALAGAPRFNYEAACSPSPADALLLYLDLLLRVQSEAFVAASSGLVVASKNCSDTLKKINDQIEILRTEIKDSHTRSQAEKLRDMVSLGNAHLAVLKATYGSPQAARPVRTALTAVSNHINRVAQDLLPPGEITLSAKAKAALEELLRLVKAFEEVPEQTGRAQQEYQCRITKIQSQINAIKESMFLASSSVTEAEMITSPAGAQEARNKAAEMIDAVKAKVEALKNGSSEACLQKNTTDNAGIHLVNVNNTVPPQPATSLMISILEGTARVVRNPQLIARLNKGADQRVFLPASFNGRVNEAESLFDRVQKAIEDTCPRGTSFKTAWCINLILGPLGFPDPETRIPLMAGVLLLFPCWTGDKNALIAKLAQL